MATDICTAGPAIMDRFVVADPACPSPPAAVRVDTATGPKPGWVRLLVEPVDVPLATAAADTGKLQLPITTVQSMLPGAHGLYYRGADGSKRALVLDGTTGLVSAPEAGWQEHEIFVHLAHGHRHGVFVDGKSGGDAYARATEQFARNVSLVQRLIAAAGLTVNMPVASGLKHHHHHHDKKRSARSTPTSEPMIAESSSRSESESPEETASSVLKHLRVENHELIKKLKHSQVEVTHLQKENDHLRHKDESCADIDQKAEEGEKQKEKKEKREKKKEMEREKDMEKEKDKKGEQEKEEQREPEKKREERESQQLKILCEQLRSTEDRLEEAERLAEHATRRATECESAEKAASERAEAERVRAEKAEWSLGEHRAWLQEARDKVAEQTTQLADTNSRLSEAWAFIAERDASISRLHDELDKVRWSLGEHEGWLADERARTASLIEAKAEADMTIASHELKLREYEATAAAHGVETVTVLHTSTVQQQQQQQQEREPTSLAESGIGLASEEEDGGRSADRDAAARIAELEGQLCSTRRELEEEMERRVAELSERCEKAAAELENARKSLVDGACGHEEEISAKIQELTDKEEEVNNLHTVICELRERLRNAEEKGAETEWHLGEHREWLKNEKDKVHTLEEQLRRNSEASSRVTSRRNSNDFTNSCASELTMHGEDECSEPPPPVTPPPPAKFRVSANSDDLAVELMTLSRDKHRLSAEIRELRTRPDPRAVDAERLPSCLKNERAHSEVVQSLNAKWAALEQQVAQYKAKAEGVGEEKLRRLEESITSLRKEKSSLEWQLGEQRQATNDAKWRIGELDAEVAHLREQHRAATKESQEKDTKIRDLEWHTGEMKQRCNDAKSRIGELEAELLKQRETAEKATATRLSAEVPHSDMSRLSEEKRRLECLLADARRVADEAKWRVYELESEFTSRQRCCCRHTDDGFTLRRMHEEKQRLEWRLADLCRLGGDATSRLGDSEQDLSAATPLQQPNLSAPPPHLQHSTAFLVRSHGPLSDDASHSPLQWQLQPAAAAATSVDYPWVVQPGELLRRVTFAIDVPESTDTVCLIGSFMNWECSVRLGRVSPISARREVTLTLPRGRHEFRFLVDSKGWRNSAHYPTVPNPFGSTNNVIHVC